MLVAEEDSRESVEGENELVEGTELETAPAATPGQSDVLRCDTEKTEEDFDDTDSDFDEDDFDDDFDDDFEEEEDFEDDLPDEMDEDDLKHV